jgi:hypothetical protein
MASGKSLAAGGPDGFVGTGGAVAHAEVNASAAARRSIRGVVPSIVYLLAA